MSSIKYLILDQSCIPDANSESEIVGHLWSEIDHSRCVIDGKINKCSTLNVHWLHGLKS